MVPISAITATAMLWGFSAWAGTTGSDAAAETPGIEGQAPSLVQSEVDLDDVDLEQAAKIFKRNCQACHGNKAQGVASYPKLSDKDAAYIAEKLEIYRSGERIGPNSVLMIQNAKKLSDDDIAGLSVYVTTAFD